MKSLIILVSFVSIILSGCANRPIVKFEKYQIPTQLLEEEEHPALPSVDAYLNMNPIQREQSLYKVIIQYMDSLANCNANVKSIETWYNGLPNK